MDVTWLGGDVLGKNVFWILVDVHADRGVIPRFCVRDTTGSRRDPILINVREFYKSGKGCLFPVR